MKRALAAADRHVGALGRGGIHDRRIIRFQLISRARTAASGGVTGPTADSAAAGRRLTRWKAPECNPSRRATGFVQLDDEVCLRRPSCLGGGRPSTEARVVARNRLRLSPMPAKATRLSRSW